MKTPPVELRQKVPGTFDVFVTGRWFGTIQYLWGSWRFSYLGRSLNLKDYVTPQEALSALLAYHTERWARGDSKCSPCRSEPDPAEGLVGAD